GSTFGPVQLAEVLALEGAVYVAGSTANLAGTSGALGVELDADWGSSSAPAGASLDATLTSGAPRPLNLTSDSASGRLAVTGAAAPSVLLAAIGLLDADAAAEDAPEADLASLAALATADPSGRWTGVGLAD